MADLLASPFILPSWQKQYNSLLIAAQSTRHGGTSQSPYASLNLGLHTTDKPEDVANNRTRFCQGLGIATDQLAGSYQTHSSDVLRVHRAGYRYGFDALITNKKGVILSIAIADCVPVLLYDPVQQAVGAAHAGWRGTVAKIAAKTLLAMRDAYGTNPAHCLAFIGACIDVDNYEVSLNVAEQFEEQVKIWKEKSQKYHVNLKKANQLQLENLGVRSNNIDVSAYSTVKDVGHFFSHRAENGSTGRMMAVIGIRG